MADGKPLLIQRQLSRMDSPEDEDMCTRTLQWHGHLDHTDWLCRATKYCTAVLILLAIVSFLSVILLWTLVLTVYKSINISQDPLVEAMKPNNTVLVQNFNPFYVENVIFTSAENDFLIRKVPCKELVRKNLVINESNALLNVTNETSYKVATFYLLKGSSLSMMFQIEHTFTNESVLASIYVYNQKSKFDKFLHKGPKNKEPSQVFASSDEAHKFVLSASQTDNYFIGLYIPGDSTIQEVHYIIQGNETKYNETWAETTCILTPPTNGSCAMNFANPHVNSEKNKICILGMNTGEEFATMTMKVKGNGYVNRISFILIELSFGVCGGVVAVSLLILLCVCAVQELRHTN